MKKVIFALMVVFATAIFTSCTQDNDEDAIKILSIDKDKQECTGCDNNG